MRAALCLMLSATPLTALSSDRADFPPAHDNSPADATLRAFDLEHTDCTVWTDWHKHCTRTGIGARTYCRTDPEHRATPSAPFCVGESGKPYYLDTENLPDESKAQRQSRFRFAYREREPQDTRLPDGTIRHEHYYINLYRRERPFNGQSFKYFLHPGCKIWEFSDGDITRKCSTTGAGNLPNCTDKRIAKIKSYDRLPQCNEWQPNAGCASARYTMPPPSDAVGLHNIALLGVRPSAIPVNAIECPEYAR